jgi:hypothetical protein
MENGGQISDENKEMIENQSVEIMHHAKELEDVVKKTDVVEPWVIAKVERSATDLSDVTHYLDGESKKMAKGGKLDIAKIRAEYDENEDNNAHSENVVLLAKYFGSESDLRDAKTILAKHEAIGHLPSYLRDERDALASKLYKKMVIASQSKMANGGELYVDLFEERDGMPYQVQEVLERYEDEYGEDITYEALLQMQEDMENVGYTFDYGLDAIPYGLRPIGVEITQLRDYDDDEYANGGIMAKGGKTVSQDVVYIQYRNAKKGFSIDKKYFKGEDAYKEAVKWGRKNIDNFNMDMVKFEMARGGKLDVGRYYKTKDGRQVRYLGDTKDPELGTFMNKADGVFKVRYDEIEGHDSIFANGGYLESKQNELLSSLYREIKELFSKNALKLNKDYGLTDGSNKSYLPHFSYQRSDDKLDKVVVSYYGDGLEVLGEIEIDLEDGVEIEVEFPNWNIKEEKKGFMDMGGMMAKGGEISVKVGDKVKSKSGIEGEVYESMGTFFKLKDKYGNKGQKFYSTRDFKHSEIKSMAMGGKVKFADKVESVKKSLLERKKVSPKVQKDYGKTYSPKEAEESAKRIVGSMTSREKLKKKMGKK